MVTLIGAVSHIGPIDHVVKLLSSFTGRRDFLKGEPHLAVRNRTMHDREFAVTTAGGVCSVYILDWRLCVEVMRDQFAAGSIIRILFEVPQDVAKDRFIGFGYGSVIFGNEHVPLLHLLSRRSISQRLIFALRSW